MQTLKYNDTTLGEDAYGMFMNSNKYIVMCKHYRAFHVCEQ